MNGRAKLMISIYGKEDWLGFKVSKDNPYSIHHIFKRVYYEINDISNYALLTKNSHEYLHIIECKELDLYVKLNRMLQIVNNQRFSPTKEQYDEINNLFALFEEIHHKDTTQKGKVLIKSSYYDREINKRS